MSRGHQKNLVFLRYKNCSLITHDEASCVVNAALLYATAGELIHSNLTFQANLEKTFPTHSPRYCWILSCLMWLSHCSSVYSW